MISYDYGRVIELTDADVIWPFHGEPHILLKAIRRESIDPFPAYAHDVGLVRATLAHVDQIVGDGVVVKPTVYVLHHEIPARTNGWAYASVPYPKPKDGEPPHEGIICLPGKRIPLHPAMTRYVVAHEYGHHVEYEMLRRRGLDLHKSDIAHEYAKLRGADPDIAYGGRTWHATAGELFANDFRIVVCGIEQEYWPHPGFTHPLKLAKVRKWWAKHFEAR